MSGDGWKHMPDQPRFCAVCNKRIRLKGEPVEFHTSEPKRSYHARCKCKRTFDQLLPGEQREVYVRTAEEMIRVASAITSWAKRGN